MNKATFKATARYLHHLQQYAPDATVIPALIDYFESGVPKPKTGECSYCGGSFEYLTNQGNPRKYCSRLCCSKANYRASQERKKKTDATDGANRVGPLSREQRMRNARLERSRIASQLLSQQIGDVMQRNEIC